MSRAAVVRLVAGMLLGAGILWMLGEYGWDSPRTIWAAIVARMVMVETNLGEMRARIAWLERQASDRK